MKNYVFLFFSLFIFSAAFAQVSDDDESMAYRLKKKYPDERTACVSDMEEYDFEPGKGDGNGPVVAAIMNQKVQFISLREAAMVQYGEYYDKFSAITKFKQYYKSGNSFGLYKNAKPLDRSVTSSDIFYDDSRVKFYNIMLPNMGLGAMVEVEKIFLDSKYLTRVMFHSSYATNEKVIRFKVPSWLQLDIREMNFAGNKIEKTQETVGKKTVYTFTMKDLAPIPSENSALPAAYTLPHVIILIKSFDIDGKQYKGFENVGDLYKWYHLLYKKCDNQTSSIKAKASELIKGKTSDIEKVRSIFYWVQDNIRYIAFEDGYAGFVPQTAQDVFKNKYGDCKGMANLLTEMLKLNGLDAHMTWIGTRHIPYDYSVPSLCVDNHCISTVYLGGKSYFLDATEKYVPFGEYAYRIQGKEALIEKGESYEVIKVPVADKSQNKILTQASFVLQDNILKGHLKITFTGEERTGFHQFYQGLPTDRKKEFLQDMLEFGNDNLVAANVKTSDLNNRETPVVIEGDIDLSNNIIRDEKEVYAGIDFFPRKLSSYMPDEKRVAPYEFNSIYTVEDEIELNIAGYKVTGLPETMNQQATDYGFNGSYSQQGNKILLKKQLSINTGRVKKDDFTNWSDFLKKLKDFNNNIVVVEKDPNYVAPKEIPVAAPAPVKQATKPVAKPATKTTTPVKKPNPKQ
ncbi:MAG: transglutaminase domain-containing protein [Bacteroidota bacterium]